ncbi:hypothetical protein SLEP1_g41529 [Rubroshorea leprosula]|uniref:Uncharacterized protein n=1 Tax=Rubroshorea leprosula TaxID=152421 RepID=A0AAV5L7A3_9ROSI|nr:hypothetical protein SLEP1_g41529 [Rubroshorea leprosula]
MLWRNCLSSIHIHRIHAMSGPLVEINGSSSEYHGTIPILPPRHSCFALCIINHMFHYAR